MASTFVVASIISDIAVLTNSGTAFSANTRVTDTQVTYWLEQAVRTFSALLRQYHAEDRDLITSVALNTVASQAFVTMPATFGELNAVLWARGVNDYVLLRKANQSDLVERDPSGWDAVDPVYRLEGETIAFYPTPTKVHPLQVFYTNHLATPLGASIASRVDADRWLALDVAVRVATAKRQPTAEFQQQKALIEDDLLSFARNRDEDEVITIRDTRGERALAAYRKQRGW